jgi:hypothetical protein
MKTRYEMESPVIESWVGDGRCEIFRTQPPIEWVPGLFPVGETAEACQWLPNPVYSRG